jgi:chromosome segregation ATPase
LIEQAIFICIGFLVAALLALAAAPAITRRARRLAEARARLQAPLTEAQAIAERDALRAQHAVDQLRLEQRLRAVEEVAARRWIEIGRQATRLAALEEVGLEVVAQREELAAQEREACELRAQLGAVQLALRDATFQRDAAEAAFAGAEARRRDLETLADRNRVTVATLQTRLSTLEVQLADSGRAAKSTEAEGARLAAALEERTSAADRLATDLDATTAQAAKVAADLAAARARLGEAEAALSRSEAAREEALLESARQFARIAERDAALREAEAAGRDFAERASRLAAANAIAEGALRAERAERTELQRIIDAMRARPAESSLGGGAASDQALRDAILRLGRDVARLKGKRGAAAEASNLVGFDRREAQPRPAAASEATHPPPAGKVLQGQPMAPER